MNRRGCLVLALVCIVFFTGCDKRYKIAEYNNETVEALIMENSEQAKLHNIEALKLLSGTEYVPLVKETIVLTFDLYRENDDEMPEIVQSILYDNIVSLRGEKGYYFDALKKDFPGKDRVSLLKRELRYVIENKPENLNKMGQVLGFSITDNSTFDKIINEVENEEYRIKLFQGAIAQKQAQAFLVLSKLMKNDNKSGIIDYKLEKGSMPSEWVFNKGMTGEWVYYEESYGKIDNPDMFYEYSILPRGIVQADPSESPAKFLRKTEILQMGEDLELKKILKQ